MEVEGWNGIDCCLYERSFGARGVLSDRHSLYRNLILDMDMVDVSSGASSSSAIP